MDEKQKFAIQSLIATVVLNGILLVVLYLALGDALQEGNRIAIFWGSGVAVTVVLWFAIQLLGRRAIEEAAAVPMPPATKPVEQASKPTPEPQPAAPSTAAAVQLLAILQRQGRLVDFLQEDLNQYQDDQIGAAVRNVHAGCNQALAEHVQLVPIFEEAEGSPVTLEAGFDARSVRLVGDVVGDPPFQGTLRHRGWRVTEIALPQRTPGQDEERIVAAAEVEVTGGTR